MKNKKLIIFDLDGVIIDSWDYSYQININDWPHLKEEDHRDLFKGNIHEVVAKMPPSATRTNEERERWIREEHLPKKKKLPIFEGIRDVIKKISEKHIMVINTSASSVSTQEYLNHNELNFFDAIYGTEVSKNKTEKFKKIMLDYKVSPNECLFITDTLGDLMEAKKVFIPTLAVTYGYHDRSYFLGLEDDVVGFSEKPSDILNFI